MFKYNLLRGYHTAFMLPALLAGLLLTAPAQANHIFSVNSTVDLADSNPGNGVCAAAGGACTLRAAVQEANALITAATPHNTNVTIGLAPGTYILTGVANEDNAVSGDLDILGTCPSTSITTPCLTITGNGVATTIIDGNLTDRIFHIIGRNTVKITGVTLRNGNAINTDGGAIKNTNGWLTLENCTITNNKADGTTSGLSSGGGIYNGDNAQMVINNCKIDNNFALNPQANGSNGFFGGGGIFNSGILTLKNSYVEFNNGRPFGGGIQNTSGLRLGTGKLTIEGSIIQDNTNGAAQGGGLGNYGGAVIMTRTIVRRNKATFAGGGGIHNTNGANEAGSVSGNVRIISSVIDANEGGGLSNQNSMDISYSTISNNTTAPFGGAANGAGIINISPGELAVQNSTITRNVAARTGGGIANGHSMTLTNVTVSGNRGDTPGLNGGDEIYINTQDTTGDRTTFVNTIIGGNASSTNNCAMGGDNPVAGPVTAGLIISQGKNLENGTSCGLGAVALNASPNLGVLALNGSPTPDALTPDTLLLDPLTPHPLTLMPGTGSAVIGAGTCIYKFDQRQFGRPGLAGNTLCDIGAVETDGDPVVGKVDLEVTMTGNVPTVSLSNPVTYTIKVTNNGPGAAQGVAVTTQIPLGTTYLYSTDAANSVTVACTPVVAAAQLSCALSPATLSLASGASFTVFVVVTPTDPLLNGTVMEVRARADAGSPSDYLPGNNGSLTTCISGACVLTAIVAPNNNFGTNNGGGGVFGLLELLLLGTPGALLLRRRKTLL